MQALKNLKTISIPFLFIAFLFSSQLLISQTCTQNLSLKWSTFQGGNGAEEVVDMYVDPNTHQIYSIAKTTSTTLIATNGDLGLGGVDKTYIQCMNNNGTLIWSTLISDWTTPHNIYVDDTGNVILFGHTAHSNLPMSGGGLDKVFSGSSDMVYFKLDPTGASIISSSYIGGNGYEFIKGLNTNIDFYDDKIYGVVSTSSIDITTSSNALRGNPGGAFIFSYDFSADNYAYRSYYDYSPVFSGADIEDKTGTESLTVDQNGNVYLVLWNGSNDFTLTTNYITAGAIISDYPVSAYNFPPLLIVLDDFYNQSYGSYITNIIDNFSTGPFPGCHNDTSPIINGTPGTHNWFGFDIDVDITGSIYILQNSVGFRGPVHQDLSGALSSPLTIGPDPISISAQGCQSFRIGSNIIKLSQNSLTDFQVDYVHNLAYGDGRPNKFKFEIDQNEQINLIETTSIFSQLYLGAESINYSESFVQQAGLTSFTIFGKESDEILYHVRPSDDPLLDNLNPSLTTGRLYDLHISDDDIYLFGKTVMPSFPTTPSYRDQDLGQQVFTQQPDYASGDTDGFITVLHSTVPSDNNSISDFDPALNTFCEDSYIHKNYGPIDGAAVSWLSGDGSQGNHIVPDIKKDNTTSSHPIQYNSSFIQWQKSYDNINWIDIAGAQQEDYSPAPEAQSGDVYYRRVFRSCSNTVESNTTSVTITGSNDMIVDVGPSPYQHCTGSPTSLVISVTGGSGDVSWQWYNGYATTTDISPSMGSSTTGITADVISSVEGAGVYRIVVTDNNSGCEVEALVTVRDPSVTLNQQYYICPGQTTCVNIGPSFSDPDIMYQWSGPNGFTSNLANICVMDVGVYTLTLNSCPSTTVTTELIQNPHDANLTTIPDYTFCQFDPSMPIGMNTTAPTGYTFQWAPTQNVSDITDFNPNYNPVLSFPSNPQNYTFTALRQIDGCVFEEDFDITINEFVDVNLNTNQYFCTGSDNLELTNFNGHHIAWTITATTFPGGLSALQSDPLFSFGGSAQLTSSSLNPIITYPQLSANSYTITVDVEGSSIPLPNSCSDTDNAVLTIYQSCVNIPNCTSCPPFSCNWSVSAHIPPGTDGLCSGVDQVVTLGPSGSMNTYEWNIISIDGTPTTNSPLIGIFDQNGNLLTTPGPHPNTVILDIDNPSPGAYDNIEYQLTTTSITGIVCTDVLKVYSSDIYDPIVDLIPDYETCDIGNSILQSGSSIPLIIDGSFYNSAPNSNIDWNWQGSGIQNGDTPFPTFTDNQTSTYTAIATDILSGCKDSDQITINVSDVTAGAGIDISDVCSGSVVQINGPIDNPLHSYVWTPPAGLNFPIGTPNNMVSSPYATVDQNITYTLTTTAPGCVTEDQMMITTSTAPPPNHPDQNYDACLGDNVQIILDQTFLQDCNSCTYVWTHISGGNISYLNNTTIPNPVITIPFSQVNNTVQFQLETTKGNCGSDVMIVMINISDPQSPQIPQSLSIDCGLPLSAIDITNHVAGNQYEWSIIDGLYEDANMTIPLSSNVISLSTVYAYTNLIQSYNVITIGNGCFSSPSTISVISNMPLIADAGFDVDICSGTNSATLGTTTSTYTNTTTFNWSPTGISIDPYATTFNSPTAVEEADMLSWLNSSTILNPLFQQGTFASGAYEYTLTTQDGDCIDEDIMIIRVLESTFPSGFAGQSQNKCIDDCFYLLANPNPDYSYTWTPFPSSEAANMTSPYSNNPLVCPQGDVTYSVYITENSTGCISNTEYVTYTLYPSPVIDDELIELCQTNITVNLTLYVPNYSTLVNPIWTINDGSGTVITNPSNYLFTSDIEFVLYGENQYGCGDEGVISLVHPIVVPNADSFYKIIGDVNDNVSKKVKFFDDHIYITYDHYINGMPHASMIKYDRLGNLIWHTTMDYVSSINDFIQDEDCQILAVGYKGQFSNTIDNESLILRFDSYSGTIVASTAFQNNGREEMKKIIRKKVGSNNSYYISGTRNGSPTPNAVDLTCLYHYSLNGTLLFNNYYTDDLMQLDEEGDRGLLELSDGNVLLFGNDGPTGKGLIMKINGSTGNFINGMFTNDIIDFYDAVEASNGDILVVGERFNDDEGSIVVIDASLNILSSVKFDNITDFKEIKYTSGSNYLIAGKAKNADGYPVLFSVDYSSGILSTNNGNYINSFESDYNTFWFDYDELNNKVAYSDTRTGNPNGFGMKDILVGIFDLNLTTLCSQSYIPNLVTDNVSKTAESFNKYPFSSNFSTAPNTLVFPVQEKSNICGCEDNMVNFDGINDFTQKTGITLSGDFTISAWFNSDMASSGNAEDRIISMGPNSRLEIGIEEGGGADGELWVYDPSIGVVTTGDFVRDGLWHHVVLTKNSGLTEIYLDDLLVSSYTVSGSNSYGSNMRMGNWAGGGSVSHFQGNIDEVSIWDVGMTSSAISDLTDCTLSGTEPNLIAYYDMNIGFSAGNNSNITSVPDISGSGNDMSFFNFGLNGVTSNLVCSTTGLSNDCEICNDPPLAVCAQNLSYNFDPLTGQLIINVTDIDNGSSSPCGNSITLSFDPNSIVSTLTFDCPEEIGEHDIILYVNDSNGTQASCNTTIEILCPNTEMEWLIDFYESTNGDMWTNNTDWLTNCDPCGLQAGNEEWFGINCHQDGSIGTIALTTNNLTGELPASIDSFKNMVWFDVTRNSLTGPFPDICNWKDLFIFKIGNPSNVGDNEFSGSLPTCLNEFEHLVEVLASDAGFSGPLPDFNPVLQEDLVTVDLQGNSLSGGIPPSYGDFSWSNRLIISNNSLNGCYDYRLYGICNNSALTPTSNATISDGNMFAADWDDFCSTGAGFCCVDDLYIDTDPIQSGFYFARNTITIDTDINAGSNVVLDAPVVNFIYPATTILGATVTTNNVGCQ